MQVSEPTFLGLLASKFLSPRAQERLGPCAQASQSTKVISEHTGWNVFKALSQRELQKLEVVSQSRLIYIWKSAQNGVFAQGTS